MILRVHSPQHQRRGGTLKCFENDHVHGSRTGLLEGPKGQLRSEALIPHLGATVPDVLAPIAGVRQTPQNANGHMAPSDANRNAFRSWLLLGERTKPEVVPETVVIHGVTVIPVHLRKRIVVQKGAARILCRANCNPHQWARDLFICLPQRFRGTMLFNRPSTNNHQLLGGKGESLICCELRCVEDQALWSELGRATWVHYG
mmetsp:Transcript_1816/g.5062  ORF Transcript_1816/g.5062 Transcript_1816/m.5062 type:complete len:202 (-) Transcript_1816:556-1161(-)